VQARRLPAAMAVELAGATSHQQLGQLAPLVEDSNLLALLLGKLSSRDRFCLAHLCRKMCHKVRAAHLLMACLTPSAAWPDRSLRLPRAAHRGPAAGHSHVTHTWALCSAKCMHTTIRASCCKQYYT
jgi:hypothetical protein